MFTGAWLAGPVSSLRYYCGRRGCVLNVSSPELPHRLPSASSVLKHFCWTGGTNPGDVPPPYEMSPISSGQPALLTAPHSLDDTYLQGKPKALSDIWQNNQELNPGNCYSTSRMCFYPDKTSSLLPHSSVLYLLSAHLCMQSPPHHSPSLYAPSQSSLQSPDMLGTECSCKHVLFISTAVNTSRSAAGQQKEKNLQKPIDSCIRLKLARTYIHHSHKLWFVQCQKRVTPLSETAHNLQSSVPVGLQIRRPFSSLHSLHQVCLSTWQPLLRSTVTNLV